MNFFKSSKGKWILINVLAIIVLIGTISVIALRNFSGQSIKKPTNPRQFATQEQIREMTVYKPLIQKAVEEKLGYKPEEIEYEFTGIYEELKAVRLVFSNSDKSNYAYLKSDAFDEKKNKMNIPGATDKFNVKDKNDHRPRYRMEIAGYEPAGIETAEMVRRKVDLMINKIYTSLIDQGGYDFYDVDDDDPYAKKAFYHALSDEQQKVFLENYEKLSKLKKKKLTKELIRLGLVKKYQKESELSQTEELKNLKTLAKAKMFIIKNLRYEDSYDDEDFKIGESKPFKTVEEDKQYHSPTILEIRDISEGLDNYDGVSSYKLTKIKKTGENTYIGHLEGGIDNIQAEITVPKKLNQE